MNFACIKYIIIDYLIIGENYDILEYIIPKIEYIYFVNFDENSVLSLLDNLTIEDKNDFVLKIINIIR